VVKWAEILKIERTVYYAWLRNCKAFENRTASLAIHLENLVNILGPEIDSNDLFFKTNEIKEYVEELYKN
jgi:hypothetical protein